MRFAYLFFKVVCLNWMFIVLLSIEESFFKFVKGKKKSLLGPTFFLLNRDESVMILQKINCIGSIVSNLYFMLHTAMYYNLNTFC